ncbi:MAG: polysaccharide pyruvyl transferase family protein [Bacteroidales bacterium]|nr:polysaccharide pyruvyl transferase family protein [Bacteroidales bacterium]
MKVAIITLPLHTNYGGLLQAFALKRCLTEIGHEVCVLDLEDKMPGPKPFKAPFVYARRMLVRMLKGSAAPEIFRERRFREEFPVVGANTEKFISERIAPRVVRSFSQLKEGEYDAFVVGSDQVWRPRYFPDVENAFLAFAKGWDVKRIAYAASFGTSELEYESEKLSVCADLLSSFDAVSVREESGVRMCSEWFDREDVTHVLDPVMLLDVQAYRDMASSAEEHPAKGKLVTYMLDDSAHKRSVVDFISRAGGFEVHDVSVRPYDRGLPLEERVVPALEQWLAGFADADFVVTDSFHGCVLAVLFHKRFIAVGNTSRGLARLQSLTEMFGLDQRLVQGIDPEDDGEYFLEEPDWMSVEGVLQKRREECLGFLKSNLK